MISQKKYPPKVARILEQNGYFNDSSEERQNKHKEFIRNVPKVLHEEEKRLLLRILDETHRSERN